MAIVEKMRMTAYKNLIAVEFKYFDLQEFLPKLYFVVYLWLAS